MLPAIRCSTMSRTSKHLQEPLSDAIPKPLSSILVQWSFHSNKDMATRYFLEQKELNTRARKGQDATNITSVPTESCIQFLWSMMPILLTALTWMAKKHAQSKHHRGFHRGNR